MKVLSLFDGIACGRLALERAGIPVEKYYASEIDKHAIQVAQKNYPDIIQVGDVTKLNYLELLDVDLVIGGSPCQDLSIAKQNRQGLRGERSGLFWKYVEALETIHPRWFLLENVASMKNEDRDAITATLKRIYPETECIMINSALMSAQQRKRYYWTNWHVEQPRDKGILLKDILENGQCIRDGKGHAVISSVGRTTEREYFKKNQGDLIAVPCALRSWPRIKKEGVERFKRLETKNDNKANSLTCVQTDSMVCMPVPENTKKGYAEIQPGECVDLTQMSSKTRRGRSMKDKSNCLTASNPEYYQYVGPVRIGELDGLGKGQANRIYSVRGKSVCLNANGGGSGAKTGLYKVDLPDGDYVIRKLTPVECERLQTLPDGWTEGVSNTQRYKAIGNGWTVDVIAHILKGIK
jgi:DNA (cytosine-5)-methyltransferase 3A